MSIQKTISRFLIHPVFISCIVTTLIVLLFIPIPDKYSLKIVDETFPIKTNSIIYDDLDGNGYSDKIEAQNYAKKHGIASLLIQCNPYKFFNDWGFKGSYSFDIPGFLITGDYNNDEKKEVYVFTVVADSIFLNIISDIKANGSVSKSKFITTFKPWNGKPNFEIIIMNLVDMNRDSFKDMVFSINSGFSADPRSVFIYDIKNDSLKVSPKKGYFGRPTAIGDINGDGYNEIILNGYAIQNVTDTFATPIHDRCCWLIVYDHNLNYLFPPRKFPDIGYSVLTTLLMPGKKAQSEMFACYIPPESSEKNLCLIHFDPRGQIMKTCSIPGNTLGNFVPFYTFHRNRKNYLAVSVSENEIYCFDTAFNQAFKIKIKKGMFHRPDTLDIDSDGVCEVLSMDENRNIFTVFRQDLNHPVSVTFHPAIWSGMLVSVIKKPGNAPLLSVFNGTSEFILSYKHNPYYYTRWAVYLAISLSIYLFILLIRRIQSIQLKKQQQTEKKITELQMKIVRNQMDPHFTMNAINAVVDAINREAKEDARDNLLHFSRMYRSLILSADKIKRSLGEEIEFTENYLALEKFRNNEKFSYQIEIDPSVEQSWEVPKMVIQSPVENAVKHGFRNTSSGGLLTIHAKTSGHELILEITDNGMGRDKASRKGSSSTGKGQQIMAEFFELYYKITRIRVHSEITDLYDPEGHASGTRVRVSIPRNI